MRGLWIFIGLALIAAAGGIWWWQQQSEAPRVLPEGPRVQAPAQPQGPRHPLPAPVEEKPLPPLRESDPTVLQALEALMGPKAISEYLRPESLARHIVVTVDNLPRKTYAVQMSPVQSPRGMVRTTGKGEVLTLSAENYARYAPYVRLMESVDTSKLAATYQRLYPLLQEAYVELGYPNAYFNDRLVEVIDHLLETPEVKGPIKLTVTKVLPEFADPALEERSAGQKLLLRMGPENAARVKAKLRAVRAQVAK